MGGSASVKLTLFADLALNEAETDTASNMSFKLSAPLVFAANPEGNAWKLPGM